VIEWIGRALLGLFLAGVEGTWGAALSWGGARPDLLLAFLVFTAMSAGAKRGAWIGFSVGLLRDLGHPTLLGLGALTGSLIGFTAGRFAEKVDRESLLVRGLGVLLLGLGGRLLEGLLSYIMEREGSWAWFFRHDVLSVVLAVPAALIGAVSWRWVVRRQPGR
jgi:rod shape-determining protein MreD